MSLVAATPPPRVRTSRLRTRLRRGLLLVERFLAVVGLCFLVYHACLDYAVIVSGSMSPALQGTNPASGDRVLFEKATLLFRAPRRWEVHQFQNPDGLLVGKRIVGLPGESVAIRDGLLLLDGTPLPIPPRLAHLRYFAYGNLAGGRTVDCGTGYYVLGDDTRDSFDSRYIGVVPAGAFTARAWLVLGPPSRRGLVH